MTAVAERWLIAGPRPPIPDSVREQVRGRVRELPPGTIVVTGGAMGVDLAAENEARRAGLWTESWRVEEVFERRPETGTRWHAFAVRRLTHDAAGRSDLLLPARWGFDPSDRDGRRRAFGAAAYWRNARMVEVADHAEVWWDGKSRGTAHTRGLALRAGKLRADRRFDRAA